MCISYIHSYVKNRRYYEKEIKFDENGGLVKPVTVAKGSPAYNQILKEAKACGVIKG